MDQGTISVLFALLRSVICGRKLTEAERILYSPQQLPDLMKIASKHDIGHLIAYGLSQNALVPAGDMTFEKPILKAVYRYERLNFEYGQVCAALEAAKIPFIPLKGSVLRKYYAEAWMRTSCDIDILVHEDDVEKAKSVLMDQLGFSYHGKGSHDISLFSPANVHVELHYDLVEQHNADLPSKVLKTVWDTVAPREGFTFWCEMSDEMYYFYHIAHMAKHFANGGCGVRPFIDLFILEHIPSADYEKRNKLLGQGDLLKFAKAACKLSRVWLENEEHDPVSKQLEDYILKGGVYGNATNRIVVQQQKKGGRVKYALSKIFIPYEVIKFHYPILQKRRWLTPFMEVRRWFKLIFCGHLKRTTKELRYNSKVSEDTATNTQNFLRDIGLN